MLKIRLQRTGRINDPSFRIVVAEHARSAKAGKFVEHIGSYNPKSKVRVLNAERVTYWLSVGAQASDTVHNMLISEGIISGKKINVLPRKSPPAAQSTAQAGPPQKEDEQKAESSEEQSAPRDEAKPEVVEEKKDSSGEVGETPVEESVTTQ